MTAAEKLVAWLFKNLDYFQDPAPAIPWVWTKGTCNVFLVLGENAGGKSFFRRLVCQVTRDWHDKKKSTIKEVIRLSMEGRTAGGIMSAMIYGSEGFMATGEITAHTVKTAVTTCREREHGHMLYWDEPDIGMSEGAILGVGEAIVEFAQSLPKHTHAVFITTHSRALVRQLKVLDPHYIHLGTRRDWAPQTIDEWLDLPIKPIRPEQVRKASRSRFKKIQKILDKVKREKRRR